MKKLITVSLAILLGMLCTEAGLRFYFHESEATRSYWGKGAFVPDATLGYRHAPSTTAWASREGSFGPFPITTNEFGYRDNHVIKPGDDSIPRVAVGGASFTFGLGVGNDDEIFHVKLERLLRDSGRFPPNIEVVNLSQTGYHLDQVCNLVGLELDRVRPRVVVLALNQYDKFLSPNEFTSPEFMNGYRLAPDRILRGGIADYLRTHSFVMMRCAYSPLLNFSAYYRDQLLLRFLKAGTQPARTAADADGATAGGQEIPEVLHEFRKKLEQRGIELLCMVIYRPGDNDTGLGRALKAAGYRVVEIRCKPGWVLTGDGHWNATGHREAADLVAKEFPVEPFAKRGRGLRG